MKLRDLFAGRRSLHTNSGNAYTAELLHLLCRRFELTPEHRGAVVGTTSGRLSSLFLHHGFTITAVEANMDRYTELQEVRRRWPRLTVVHGEPQETGLPEGGFDFVVSERALYHAEPEKVRAEFARLLRPDGIVALITDNRVYGGSSQGEAFTEMLRTYCERFREKRDTFAIREGVNAFFPDGGCYEDAVLGQQVLSRRDFIAQTSALPIFPREGERGYMEAQVAVRSYFARWAKNGELRVPFVHRFAAGRVNGNRTPEAGAEKMAVVGCGS